MKTRKIQYALYRSNNTAPVCKKRPSCSLSGAERINFLKLGPPSFINGKTAVHCSANQDPMNRTGKTLLFASLLFCSFSSFAQSARNRELLRHLSREDMHDFLLYQSKQAKSKATGAAIVGPILTGVGLYLLQKENSANWRNESPSKMYGAVLSSVGFVVSVSSIPLFISAGKIKREANLFFKAGSSAAFNNKVIPAAGLQVNF